MPSFGDLFGGGGNFLSNLAVLAGAAGEGGEDERRQITELFRSLNLPGFDFSQIPAPFLPQVGERTPQPYAPVIQGQPTLPEDSPEVRRSQLADLAYLGQVRDEGLPLAERLRAQDLQRMVAGEHRRGTEGALEELARRGRLGGGAEAQYRLAAGQQGAELARGMGSDLMQEAVMNRLRGALGGAQVGEGIRLQDIALSGQKANVLNRWNQFVSQLGTQAAAQAAGSRERAQAYNVGTAQGLSDTNAMAQYQAALENLNRMNQLSQTQFGNQLSRASGIASGLGGQAWQADAEQSNRAQNIRSLGPSLGRAVGGMVDVFAAGKPKPGARTTEEERRGYTGRSAGGYGYA